MRSLPRPPVPLLLLGEPRLVLLPLLLALPALKSSVTPAPIAGWDLAVKLLTLKNEFNRGRLSCSGALRHPFLLLPA